MTKDLRCFALLVAATATLAACASTPDVEPVPEPEPVEEMVDAPVEATPQVIAPTQPRIYQPPVQTGPVAGSEDDFVATSGGDARVYFGYDQFTLTPEARSTLRQQADWLKRYSQYTAVIEGHADERGTRQYNIALGARRANSVKAFLVSQGVQPSRLTTVSYGKERPIDARSTEAGWSRNRNGYTNLRPIGRS